MWCPPHLFQFPFLLSPLYPIPFASPSIRPCNHGKGSAFVSHRVRPPRSVFVVSRERGGLWRVIASQCPCTSSAVWTPGLWTGLGPASSESGPGAWCQTSWQTCSCRSDAGQNGPGQPSETPGSSGGWERERERERQTIWIMHHKLFWPFGAYCNYSRGFIEGHIAQFKRTNDWWSVLTAFKV